MDRFYLIYSNQLMPYIKTCNINGCVCYYYNLWFKSGANLRQNDMADIFKSYPSCISWIISSFTKVVQSEKLRQKIDTEKLGEFFEKMTNVFADDLSGWPSPVHYREKYPTLVQENSQLLSEKYGQLYCSYSIRASLNKAHNKINLGFMINPAAYVVNKF